MIRVADKKKIYTKLYNEDVRLFLECNEEKDFDLVVSADLLCYLGDLSGFFSKVH